MFNDDFKSRYQKIPLAISDWHTGLVPEVLLHWHKEIELITVNSGRVDFYVNGELFALASGDTLVIPPCALHRVTVDPDADTNYICVCFDSKLLCDRELCDGLDAGSLSISPLICATENNAARAAELVSEAYRACLDGVEGWELAATAYISLFFSMLKSGGRIIPCIKQGHDRAFCMKTMAYIKENYREQITSRTAAEALFINNSYFCRQFQRNFGIPFSSYLLNYRVEKSKELLRHSQMPISRVANEVGFGDFSYFSKNFKNICGTPPSEYRRRCESADRI